MTSVTEHDWYAWYHDYDDPATPLARRLAAVQERIRAALDAARPGPLRAISVCAGQGRDLIGALAGHPRQHDVRARLVEIDPRNADVARQAARAFAGRLADRQSLMIPAEDPEYGDLGQAFPPWPAPARDAILQPPKPEIQPSPRILGRAMDHDLDMEAAD